MTFESFANNTAVNEEAVNKEAVPAVNEEAMAIKVSYGDDLRRANVTVTAYVALRDHFAQLFELDPATVVLKYQDNEGDKITVSSDAEVRDALQFAKEKNILRLFVEVKAIPAPAPAPAAPAPVEQVPANNAFPFGRRFGGPLRGGFPHGGFVAHPRPFPPQHFGHHGLPQHFGATEHVHYINNNYSTNTYTTGPFTAGQVPYTARQASDTTGQGPYANFTSPYVFGHGVFSPADAIPPCAYNPHDRHALKEQMHAMKAQIKAMKASAVTEEDFQAIKDLKEQMRAECKLKWHELKSEKKAYKSECKADKKKEWKQEKKCKGDKKCKRDKKEKKDKKAKKCKDDRLVAKHVADVTIPDNTELPADVPATKIWRLKNAGLLAWPADSQLIFLSHRGDNLNGPERVFVGAVEPQQEVEVSVTFIAPAEPGRYIGFYRMATADGKKFGQRVCVSFSIPAAVAPVDQDAPSAPLLYPNPSSPTTHAPLVVPLTQEPPKAPSHDLLGTD